MSGKTGFVCHPDYLKHDTGPHHPESPQRLRAIEGHLAKTGLLDQLVKTEPLSETDVLMQWIGEIHTPLYIRHLERSSPAEGAVYLDPDTVMTPFSLQAAITAVGGCLSAVDGVMEGRITSAFCALRPPGHHAEAGRAMGFCLFNTVAIAARYVQKKHGLGKVLIVDWDVHHGNGTQNAFYDDPTVLYFSTHQYPFYPGTGRASERGRGEGEGFTMNCPLSAGTGDDEYIRTFEEVLAPAVESFRPDFILISAGFDAHRDDPLAGMKVTEEGYRHMTRILKDLAGRLCQNRIVSCLEGGYNLTALARSVEAHITTLME